MGANSPNDAKGGPRRGPSFCEAVPAPRLKYSNTRQTRDTKDLE